MILLVKMTIPLSSILIKSAIIFDLMLFKTWLMLIILLRSQEVDLVFLFSFLIFIFLYSIFRTRVRVRVTRSCCHTATAGHIR